MVRTHASTPEQRAQWTASMLAHRGDYGLITRLSRENGVSRPTLYAWRAQAERALLAAFTPATAPPTVTPALERQILEVWSAHSSDRDIQSCFRALRQQGISLTTITAILADADQRALRWLATAAPPTVRALALDELYANNRRGAYLSAVDVHSGVVWASAGPLAVDTESWILLLWDLQDRGLVWDRLTMAGGAAARAASRTVTPEVPIQGDQWHRLHSCAHLQARLVRQLHTLQQQTTVVARQAARIAAGQPPRGRNPKTDVAAHVRDVAIAQRLVNDEVIVSAPAPHRRIIEQLERLVREDLPELLTFVAQLDRVQADLHAILPPARQVLLGWAWLQRNALGWSARELLAAIPPDWRDAARVLLAAWADAVRVSTAVERWHSILRVHVTVHRSLSPGRLALLAVWHNHRVFTRGVHKGQSPLHLSGMREAPTDWLVALGYPPAAEPTIPDRDLIMTPAIARAA